MRTNIFANVLPGLIFVVAVVCCGKVADREATVSVIQQYIEVVQGCWSWR